MKAMKKLMRAMAVSAMILIGLGMAQTVHAVEWSSVAAGCVLDSASVALADTNAIFGTVTFTGTSTGTIRLTCPVSVLIDISSVRSLNVNYYDPDGAGATCRVQAFLLRTNTNELERGNTIVEFDSNTGLSTTEAGTGRRLGFVTIPERLDSNANYYWVALELSRADTSCNPLAVGAYIDTPVLQ
jgi:hypothetical protein